MSGITYDATVIINSAEIKSKIDQDIRQAQAPLDALILADSNYFCPIKTGKLQPIKSSEKNTLFLKSEVLKRLWK